MRAAKQRNSETEGLRLKTQPEAGELCSSFFGRNAARVALLQSPILRSSKANREQKKEKIKIDLPNHIPAF